MYRMVTVRKNSIWFRFGQNRKKAEHEMRLLCLLCSKLKASHLWQTKVLKKEKRKKCGVSDVLSLVP